MAWEKDRTESNKNENDDSLISRFHCWAIDTISGPICQTWIAGMLGYWNNGIMGKKKDKNGRIRKGMSK